MIGAIERTRMQPVTRVALSFRRGVAVSAAAIAMLASCGGRKSVRAVTPRIGATQTGIASWYGSPFHGRRGANGEVFDMAKLTAAHRTFAFGTWVRVHNLDNGMTVDVRITDRGPFVRGRVIDLSRAAAREISMIGAGIAKVRLEVIRPPEPGSTVGVRASSTEKFAVQAGAFRDRARAEALRARLEKEAGVARLIRKDAPEALWRVVAGQYEYIEDAEAFARKLRENGTEAFAIRLDAAGEQP